MNCQIEAATVHCYTNPSFCRQSEYIPDERSDLPPPPPPPPPQFQCDELPPPPPSSQQLENEYGGQTNAAFQSQPETVADIQPRINTTQNHQYCYLEDSRTTNHRRYVSLPVQKQQQQQQQRLGYNNHSMRYEYIGDERVQLQRTGSSRYEIISHQQQKQQQQQQQQQQVQRSAPSVNQNNEDIQLHKGRSHKPRYAVVLGEQDYLDDDVSWENAKVISPVRKQITTPRGQYTSLPLEEPPIVPERNVQEYPSGPSRSELATQKLHEILSTPRKPRSRSVERSLSCRRQSLAPQNLTPRRRALTPDNSPTGRTLSPTQRENPVGTLYNRVGHSPNVHGPQTSTPSKEPSARRCLPLNGSPSFKQDVYSPKLRYVGTAPIDLAQMDPGYTTSSQYQYFQSASDITPMVLSNSPKYKVIQSDSTRNGYQSVESAFLARTAVVPPLSPPNSEANTTLASGIDKYDRKNAPLILVLVGMLTCGLAIYLSWSQGRKYYFDSAIGCGVCCALAGASRSLRRAWTGLGLAALSALSCGGLLLIAVKAPKAGTPLHDVTAGALCGVSVLGAALALLAVLRPKCSSGRHRRVHSWIPRFSP